MPPMASMRKRSAKSATSAISAPANGHRSVGSALATRNAMKTATCHVSSIIPPLESSKPPLGERFGRPTQETDTTRGAGRAPQSSRATRDEPRSVLSVQESEAAAPGVPALRHLPRPPGHTDQGQADAVVSAGNTGATMAAALLVLGRIRGIDRPALCGMLPTTKGKPACLLDAGATMDADEHNILQFARMASRFMEKVHAVDRPSVGLINVGEEPEKGGRMQLAAHALLEGAEDLNFYGNIEGRDVTRGITDICVTDGFTGNVLAKGMEGVVDVFVEGIRHDIFGGPLGKVAALFALGGLSKFRSRMDYDPYVSAPLLGVAGISVVTHGRAKATMMRRE